MQAVREVSYNYNKLSDIQRKFVAVNPNDIFLRFIYEIGMIFDDDTRTLLYDFYFICNATVVLNNALYDVYI